MLESDYLPDKPVEKEVVGLSSSTCSQSSSCGLQDTLSLSTQQRSLLQQDKRVEAMCLGTAGTRQCPWIRGRCQLKPRLRSPHLKLSASSSKPA